MGSPDSLQAPCRDASGTDPRRGELSGGRRRGGRAVM